jgi:hypothetical protein
MHLEVSMTRREWLKTCREGAVQGLPQLLGAAGAVWTVVGQQVRQHRGETPQPAAACFPTAPSANRADNTPEGGGD